MKLPLRTARQLALGALIGATAAFPAHAEDIEIYVGLNGGQSAVKPNVLFVIDTSGSMGSAVTVIEEYDPGRTYPGRCDPERIYWALRGRAPQCPSNAKFEASRLRCESTATSSG